MDTRTFKKIPVINDKKTKQFINFKDRMMAKLQRLGKALMYPIAILPFAALLNRIGQLFIDLSTQKGTSNVLSGIGYHILYWIGQVIHIPGATVFTYIALVFAIGLGFGLARDNRGEAALVGGISYLILQSLTSRGMFPELFYGHVLNVSMSNGQSLSELMYLDMGKGNAPQYILDTGVLGGIVCGCIVAWLYNRYQEIQLPAALSFFGGRRFIPMVGIAASIPLALLFSLSWPWFQFALVKLGTWLGSGSGVKIIGAFIYGVINRLMQPFGLHHILNTFLWFALPVNGTNVYTGQTETIFGDINAFQNSLNTAGEFTTGYFPMFLGGLPGAAIAMVYAASKDKRKQVWVFLGGVAFVSFLTGIDEPLAFAFIFVSPLLWGIHAIYTGILCAITIACGIHIGFGFSAGLIDYLISFKTSWDISIFNQNHNIATQGNNVLSNPLWVWPIAAIGFVMYFFTFSYLIKKMNIPTPGRKDEEEMTHMWEKVPAGTTNVTSMASSKTERYRKMAEIFLKEVGKDNIITLENCATRIRLQVKDNSRINDAAIKAGGAYATRRLGANSYQIIVGTDVEHVVIYMNKMCKMEE